MGLMVSVTTGTGWPPKFLFKNSNYNYIELQKVSA